MTSYNTPCLSVEASGASLSALFFMTRFWSMTVETKVLNIFFKGNICGKINTPPFTVYGSSASHASPMSSVA